MTPPSPSAPVRVQKYLSQAGATSRRQAEAMLQDGRIAVNGQVVAELGVRVVPGTDVVSLDGQVVRPAPRRWVVFHKPVGILCTRTDPHGGETLYDVLPAWAARLRYVGRLDRDTSGLLLLTNDGDLAAALAHPAAGVEREYLAGVGARVTAQTIRALKAGVELEDGLACPKRVRKVRLAGGEWGIGLVLAEGRKREVRRLLKAVGHTATSLCRVRFGPFRLGALGAGAWRPVRPAELRAAQFEVRARKNGRGRPSPRISA